MAAAPASISVCASRNASPISSRLSPTCPSEPGLFGIDATTDPDKREAAEAAALEILAEIGRDGISAPELAKAKRVILSNQMNALVTMRGQASDLGSNWLLTGNLDFSRDYLDAVQRVRSEDIAQVVRRYLHEDNLTLVTLDPPGTKTAPKAVATVGQAGEIQKFTLSNGLRLLVREDDRLPLVYLDAVFRGGLLAETAANNGLTKLFSRVLLKGTTNRTAEQLAEEIETVGGSIGSDAGNNSFSVSMEFMQPDLDLGLDILSDVLLNASLPSEVIEREKAVQAAAIKSEDEHLTSVARNLLRSKMFGTHPYALRYVRVGWNHVGNTRPRGNWRHFARSQYVVAKNAVFWRSSGTSMRPMVRAQVEAPVRGNARPATMALQTAPPVPSCPAPSEIVRLIEHFEDKEQAVLMVGYAGATSIDGHGPACAGTHRRGEQRPGLALFHPHPRGTGARHTSLAPRRWSASRGEMFTFYVGTDPAQRSRRCGRRSASEIAKLAGRQRVDRQSS